MSFWDWLKTISGCKEDYWKQQYELGKIANQLLRDKLKQENNDDAWDEGKKPEWLNESQTPYEPLIEIEGEQIKLKPQDIYMESRTLREKATKWRSLSHDEKLKEIWKYVIVALHYKYDKAENWLPPIVTLERKWGDCEDGTILFITLARVAHIPADKVFNACGWFYQNSDKYGHSYPIAQMSNGNWYIFESTLDTIPNSPKIFKGSNYDASWGVANWKYCGHLKEGNQL